MIEDLRKIVVNPDDNMFFMSNKKLDIKPGIKMFSERFISQKNRPLYHGQRKLAIVEVCQFIKYVYPLSISNTVKDDIVKDVNPDTDWDSDLPDTDWESKIKQLPEARKVTILYIGASPGKHIPFIYRLFPLYKYILFDPGTKIRKITDDGIVEYVEGFDRNLINMIESDNLSNIIIIQDLFSEDKYELVRSHTEDILVLISDIRTVASIDEISGKDQKETKDLNDRELITNQNLQRKWVEDLRPDLSFLKFKLPHSDSAYTDGDGGYQYLAGTTMLQPYLDSTSKETRLIVTKADIDKLAIYNIKDYEEIMFYHNIVERFQPYNISKPYHQMGSLVSFDFCYEILVLREYKKIIDNHVVTGNYLGIDKSSTYFNSDESLSNLLTKIIGDNPTIRSIKNRYHNLDDEFIDKISIDNIPDQSVDIRSGKDKVVIDYMMTTDDKLSFLDDL